ncbi:chloride channel protein 2-like isoform X2 [Oscarella lobularis]|uniref:chloride channel protein 2-like isoform X2 n=1 Tax=Oscarella lobularis TaxID=121494 RepID=UPI0033131E70
MSLQEIESESYDYEQTLMYGKYTVELQEFARSHASRIREEEAQRRDEQRNLRYSARAKAWRSCKQFVVRHIGEDWLFLLVLGLLMAFLSFVLDYLIEKCQQAHVWLYGNLTEIAILQYVIWIAFPIVLISFSVGYTHLVSPNAIGSGIPEMKTVLRGISLSEYLSIRTFLAKTIGLISSLGSGIPLGKEGPFVHIASIVGNGMTKFITHFNNAFANEAYSNELLAAACAVGVACNFAAPIGGVLFSIEVTATYFAVRNYWRGFFAAVCGAFMFRLMAIFVSNEQTITSLFTTNFVEEFPFDPYEMIAFAFIGVTCGFGGALFVFVHRSIVDLRRKYRHKTQFLERNRFIYPLVVVLILSTLTFPKGFGMFMAGKLTQKEAIDQLFSNFTWGSLSDDSGDKTQTDILDTWNNPNIFVSLLLYTLYHFFATAIAVALPVPAGVFFPVFVTGAAFGRLVGETMAAWFPHGIKESHDIIHVIVPGGYAVVGAAAMSGSVTHTISTSVIVFELTGQITHILPVMIAVLIANGIAQKLQPSFYDSIIQIKKLPYLPDLTRGRPYKVMVNDIMKRNLFFISYRSTYGDLRKLLHSSNHQSFPLVDAPDSMVLLGSIQRRYLMKRLMDEKGTWDESAVASGAATPSAAEVIEETDNPTRPATLRVESDESQQNADETVSPQPQSPSRKTSTLKRLRLQVASIFTSSPRNELDDSLGRIKSPDEQLEEDGWSSDFLHEQIDFSNCQIDPAPFQLVERTSLHKAHSLFALLGLSHSYVTSIGRLVGVVTLKDISKAIEGAHKTEKKKKKKNAIRITVNDQEDTTTASEATGMELSLLNRNT